MDAMADTMSDKSYWEFYYSCNLLFRIHILILVFTRIFSFLHPSAYIAI